MWGRSITWEDKWKGKKGERGGCRRISSKRGKCSKYVQYELEGAGGRKGTGGEKIGNGRREL